MTGSHITRRRPCPEPEVIACPCATGTFCSSTKCSTVVQVPWQLEVTKGHVTPKDGPLGVPKGFPWMHTCAIGSCAISALVGPFNGKSCYETSHVVTEVPLGVRMRNSKLRNIRPSEAFSPEMTSSAIELPLEGWGVCMRNLKLHNIPIGSVFGVLSRTSASYK